MKFIYRNGTKLYSWLIQEIIIIIIIIIIMIMIMIMIMIIIIIIAYCDVPMYAESTKVGCNRIDARLVYKEENKIVLVEMSCPWISNRDLKDKEKALKYTPQRYELC